MKTIRCAIYTRKSSDEGLEQAFNSLDAQREACAAYILSQASEGWLALPDIYDDGGLSGGTLQRPALQRLLADVAAGRVDIIVVYKVDRLTRSLFDFAKLVEALDKASTSFVSVTQSFNTTTSMGRLTLNMLLSFAQFEREVTAERIRDKIAASKAKGMWMGGTPPLGYQPNGRTLALVDDHAALIRRIFERYLAVGNVRLVEQELRRTNTTLPVRARLNGNGAIGGGFFSRGQIYKILSNPIYIGRIAHGDTTFAGLHPAIVDAETWEHVQAKLADNLQGHRSGARAERPSLLAGKVVDATGQPLLPVHACHGKVRYRYYVSRDLHHGQSATGLRIPARELETVVCAQLAAVFADGLGVAATAGLEIHPSDIALLIERSASVRQRLLASERVLVRELIDRIVVETSGMTIRCSTPSIAEVLAMPVSADSPPEITFRAETSLSRTGKRLRLVQPDGSNVASDANPSLIGLLAKARRWWAELRNGTVDIAGLAKAEGVQPSYLTRVLRLAFLSPTIVDAIFAGRQSATTTVTELTLGCGVDSNWASQERVLLAGAAKYRGTS